MTKRNRSRWMWSFVGVGGVLVFLGIVNAALGHTKIREYTALIELLAEPGPAPEETTARRRDAARRKLGFYATVERGGAWMAMSGAGLVLFGLVTGRPRRGDTADHPSRDLPPQAGAR